MHHHDTIVIGVGAMGSAVCFELSRRGQNVLGIEQFEIPHGLGSSGGLSRMIRLAYYEHPDYVPLLRRAYERWAELETLSGEKLLHLTGGLYMGPRGCELVEGSLRAAEAHQLEHELLDGNQIQQRFAPFQVPPDWVGLVERQAGFLLPEKVIAAYARLARSYGAEIHEHEKLLEWAADDSGVRIRTDRSEYRASRLIFCAGSWTDKLIRDLGIPLVVTRQVLLWFDAPRRDVFALGKLPVWGIDRPGGGLYYGFPALPGDPGVKVACHYPAAPTDPDSVDRNLLPGDADEVSSLLARHLPAAVGPVAAHKVCLYTNTPDSHFILDRHPRHPNVTLAAGFSGHGFKFASVVGEIVADLSMNGRTELPAEFLRVGHRFR